MTYLREIPRFFYRRQGFVISCLALALLKSASGVEPADPVETLTRRLRIQLYQSYRSNRSEYDRQQAELQRRVTQWEANGRTAGDTRDMIAWLSSRIAPTGNTHQTWPADDAPAERPSPLSSELTIRPRTLPTPRYTAPQPQLPTAPSPAPSTSTHPGPVVGSRAVVPPPTPTLRPPVDPSRLAPLIERTPYQPPHDLPPLRTEWSVPSPTARAVPHPPSDRLPDLKASTGNNFARSPLPEVVAAHPAPPTPVRHRQTQSTVPAAPHGPSRQRVATTSPTTQSPPVEEAVTINAALLSEKIARFNQTVLAMEDELSSTADWDVPRLEETAHAIRQLQSDRDHLQLFYAALPTNRQAVVDQIADVSIVLAQFTQRMFEVRIQYEEETQQRIDVLPSDWAPRLDELQRQSKTWMNDQTD